MIWSDCLAKGVPGDVATLDCFPLIFQRFVVGALTLAGIAAVIFIILSGIKFLLSGGDAKQVEGARKTLTYAIIGLVVILLASFIVNIIAYVSGVPCLNFAGFENCKQ